MEVLSIILSMISIINVIVLSSIISIFYLSYKKTHAKFTLSLVGFCMFLLLHNLISVQAYSVLEHLYSEQVFSYVLGIQTTELMGLLIFLKISYQ